MSRRPPHHSPHCLPLINNHHFENEPSVDELMRMLDAICGVDGDPHTLMRSQMRLLNDLFFNAIRAEMCIPHIELVLQFQRQFRQTMEALQHLPKEKK